MGKLTNLIREELNNNKDSSLGETADICGTFSTGINLLDYMNGTRNRDEDGNEWMTTGIPEGSFISIVGPSHSGKTTLALQIAGNMLKKYDDSQLFYQDLEGSMEIPRIQAITKLPVRDIKDKVFLQKKGLTIEKMYKKIKTIHRLKTTNREDFTINLPGQYNSRGEQLSTLIPTIMIIDSLALMVSDTIAEEEELSGNMSATAVARANTTFFKRVIPIIKEANIIIIGINHINTKIEINPMIHTKASLNYLKPDETMPGGRVLGYLASNIFKVEPGSKLTSDKEFGIDGFLADITMIKSRSNKAGKKFQLVLDQVNGFQNHLSNYIYLKTNKLIGGAGRGFYIGEMSDIKFSQKDFIKKLKENKKLRKYYIQLLKDTLEKEIPEPDDLADNSEEDDEEYENYEENVNEEEYEEYEEEEEEVKPKKRVSKRRK